MTKIYSINSLISENEKKEVGSVGREIVKFRKENPDRIFDKPDKPFFEYTDEDWDSLESFIVYHDEQIPVETLYKTEDVKFEYNVPRWSGATVPGTSKNCKSKYPNQTTPLSIFMGGDGRTYQTIGDISQAGKVWRSQQDYKITMISGRPPRLGAFDIEEVTKKYAWMWRVFDKKHRFTDNGRKITIDWGSKWTTVFGSKPTRDMWQEELRKGDWKFYEDSETENFDLKAGNWQDVVEAHLNYFTDLITVIMRKHRDSIPVDEATAVAMAALCEFAYKSSLDDENLRSRFATAAYSVIRNAYRDAVDTKDVISSKSLQKVQDLRTLTDLLKELYSSMEYVTLEDIKKGSGFGERRINSTFKIFDFNIGRHRDANQEEMLYTVMAESLTERQCEILERSFGLGGRTKASMAEIGEDMSLSYDTIQSDRKKALNIIKEELGDLYL